MRRVLFFLLIFIFPLQLLAAEDFYQFTSHEQQTRFETLTTQLRCLVCQNQTLAESNAPLANDLRDQIYQQIQTGQTNKDIINYLVTRYGDFILYRPPLKIATVGLWFGPLFLLIFGISYLIYYIRKKQRV